MRKQEATENNRTTRSKLHRSHQRVRMIAESSGESEDVFLQQAANHVQHQAKCERSSNKTNTIRLRIEDIDAEVEPDIGANFNIMDKYQFPAIKHTS